MNGHDFNSKEKATMTQKTCTADYTRVCSQKENSELDVTCERGDTAMKTKSRIWFLILGTCVACMMFAQVARAQTWNSAGPIPRGFHSAVLDSVTNRMVVFGGLPSPGSAQGTQNLNDVWRLSLGTLSWMLVKPTGAAPAARVGHSAVYDSGSNRMIVFGGGEGRSSPCTNDVWALENANGSGGSAAWVQLSPTGVAPPARMQHGSVYDPTTNTMIVYGGQDCFHTIFGDVWILSNANGVSGTPTWTQLSPVGSGPGDREITGGVTYDPANNVLMVFGGVSGSSFLNDVWVLSNANGQGGTPTWTELSPSGAPPSPRAESTTTYDAATNAITLFGGEDQTGALFSDTWVLSNANGLGGPPAWRQVAIRPTYYPEARIIHTAVYNSSTNQMTVFGGQITPNSSTVLDTNDVFVLSHANGH
jgi:Galactose oxidase, central domain